MNETSPVGKTSRNHAGLLWWMAVALTGGGGAIVFFASGWWIMCAVGFWLLIYSSAKLSQRWANSTKGAVGIWLFLFLSGLALSHAIAIAACSRSVRF